MHNSPILAVRGEAALEVEPDIARIEVSIAVRGPDRAATLLALTERDADESLILGDFDEIIEKSESSGARLSPHQGSRAASSPAMADAHLLSESRGPAEPRVLTGPSTRLPHRPRAVAAEEPVFDLAPARQILRAVVEARFVITTPDLAAVPG
jgi:hypothetical protein